MACHETIPEQGAHNFVIALILWIILDFSIFDTIDQELHGIKGTILHASAPTCSQVQMVALMDFHSVI